MGTATHDLVYKSGALGQPDAVEKRLTNGNFAGVYGYEVEMGERCEIEIFTGKEVCTSVVNAQRATYSLAGQPIAHMENGAELTFIHSDHLGSVTALTTATGTTVAGSVTRYLPYGEERTSPTTTLSDYGFTGHKENRDLGLVYANFRYYVPEIGRFNKADTIVPEPGRAVGYNRYAYVNNNPIRYNDPTGHRLEEGAGELAPNHYYDEQQIFGSQKAQPDDVPVICTVVSEHGRCGQYAQLTPGRMDQLLNDLYEKYNFEESVRNGAPSTFRTAVPTGFVAGAVGAMTLAWMGGTGAAATCIATIVCAGVVLGAGLGAVAIAGSGFYGFEAYRRANYGDLSLQDAIERYDNPIAEGNGFHSIAPDQFRFSDDGNTMSFWHDDADVYVRSQNIELINLSTDVSNNYRLIASGYYQNNVYHFAYTFIGVDEQTAGIFEAHIDNAND